MRQLTAIDPEHPLTVICRAGLGDFVRSLNVASRVIEVDKKNPQKWRQQRREILSREYHHVICPHESPRTAALVWQMKAKGLKVGFHRAWNGLVFNRRVAKPMQLPDALRQLSLMVAVSDRFAEEFSEVAQMSDLWNSDVTASDIDYRGIGLPVWARLTVYDEPGSKRSGENSKTILLSPGSTWATKRWTPAGYISVAKALQEQGFEVTLTGSPDERPLCEIIAKAVPGVKNQAGSWSLVETVKAMSEARALVANDSGAIHMAALVGLPTVAVFGPTVLAQGFRPWQRRALVVQKGLNCRPCGRHGHQECPIGTHACMKELPPEQVLSALKKLL